MNRFDNITGGTTSHSTRMPNNGNQKAGYKPLMWLTALLLTAVVVGCGGQDPILGGGIPGAPGAGAPGAIIPGAVCTVASGPTIPTVTKSDPTSGNQLATTSTTGVAGGGKLIIATFSLAMNPATINATTFTLKPVGGSNLVPVSVTLDSTNKVATLQTAAALIDNTSYTAIITVAVTSAGGTPIACSYAWDFKTVTPPAAGLAQINLGLATPFGIASYAGLTNTGATKINGDTLIGPTNTCNGVVLLNSDGPGFGACGAGGPPTKNAGDVVITPVYDQGITSAAIFVDLRAAYVSLSPPGAAPAGPLGPGTTILAPTTLGTGSTGQNTFTPGLYTDLAAAIQIQGDLTLDAGGNPDAVFIFQTAGSLTTISPTRILLTGGAKASNVWWQVGSSATLGVGTEFQGNILADTSITMLTGTTSCGRLLAGAFTNSGAFTFDANIVAVPGNPFVPGGTRSAVCQ